MELLHMNSMKTCNSLTYYFMKTHFLKLAGTCQEVDLTKYDSGGSRDGKPALILFGKIHFLLTSEHEFFKK